jgi:hypothetical protein
MVHNTNNFKKNNTLDLRKGIKNYKKTIIPFLHSQPKAGKIDTLFSFLRFLLLLAFLP